MSNTSKFLGALREAFQELDRINAESADLENTHLPTPVPTATLMKRIRANEEPQSGPETIPFRATTRPSPAIRLAARKGREISPETLDKMKENRGDS